MRSKILLLGVLLCMFASGLYAQKESSITDITIVNLGDGRLMFRTKSDATPIAGEYRLIDGYNSEYIVAQFAEGMYNGPYQRFRHNKLAEEGIYKDGFMDGVFFEYYSDGTSIKSEKKLSKGKLNGVLKTYYVNGKLESEKGYKDGQEDGIERKYDYETGKMTTDCNFVEGKPNGKQTRGISSNAGNYVQVSDVRMGVRHGDYTEVWMDGTIRVQAKYKNGKKEGTWTENGKNGKPSKVSSYKDGELSGELKTFCSNGSVEKIEIYVNDQKEGVCKEFYCDSGKPRAEYTYADDLREGAYKLYYDDGSLREEGRCEGGQEVFRKEFYRNGKVKQVSEYTGRGWETVEKYDSNGNQV